MRIPPLDPFKVPFIKLDQGSGSVNFKATFKDIIATNGKNFKLNKVK